MSDYNLKTPDRPVGLLQAVEKLMYWAQVSLPAVYGEELTYAKEQGKMAQKINEVVEQLNVNTEWTEYLLNEGVENETVTYINELVQNGTLSSLINNELLGDINKKLAGKRDTTYLIQPTDLSPETLKLITGDAVPVVGNNSVYQQAIKGSSVAPDKTDFVKTKFNMYNPDDQNVATGYYVDPTTGEILPGASYRTTGFMKVKANVLYALTRYFDNGIPMLGGIDVCRFVAYYNNDYVIQTTAGLATTNTKAANPKVDGFIRVTYDITTTVQNYLVVNEGSSIFPATYLPYLVQGEKISVDGNYIKEKSISYDKTNFIVTGNNLFNGQKLIDGYYVNSLNGFLMANPAYAVSEYIPVEQGKYYSSSFKHLIAFYDENYLYKGGYDARSQSPIPAPVKGYVLFSIPSETPGDLMINEGQTVLPYEPFKYYLKGGGDPSFSVQKPIISNTIQNGYFAIKRYNLTTGTPVVQSTVDFQEMGNYSIKFKGYLSSIGQGNIIIGKGSKSAYGSTVTITPTRIVVTRYSSDSTPTTEEKAHGLTITDYISINIMVNYGTADIELMTNGGKFTFSSAQWLGYKGTIYSESTIQINNCELDYYCNSWRSVNWIFGDSYLSIAPERWPYYMLENNMDNFLLNGYGGRNSALAYTALSVSSVYGTPKNLIWALGMNDGDSSTAVNTSWLNALNNVKNYCSSNEVNLILCTIPSTPTVNNNFKNGVVKAEGLPYIDFEAAVGATSEGIWYSGMLSSDNVHPTMQGAIALYSQAISDFPLLAGVLPK